MKKFSSTYQQALGILNYVAFLLVLISLAFPWRFTQPLFAIWLVTWLLEGRWANRANFSFGRHTIPVLLMCAFVGWEALSLLWTQDLSAGISELERHLPIFAILIMVLFGGNEHYKAYKLKTALLAGSLLALLSYCMIIYWFVHMGEINRWNFSYWTFFGEGPIQHMKHRQYLCIVMLSAVCFSGDVYRHFLTRYSKYACLATIGIADAILITAIVMSGSRMTILLLPIVGLIYLLREIPKRYIGVVVSCFIAVVISVSILLPRYNWRFYSMKKDLETMFCPSGTTTAILEPRVYIWSTVVRHADEFGAIGMGTGSSDGFLRKCYEEDQVAMHYGSPRQK